MIIEFKTFLPVHTLEGGLNGSMITSNWHPFLLNWDGRQWIKHTRPTLADLLGRREPRTPSPQSFSWGRPRSHPMGSCHGKGEPMSILSWTTFGERCLLDSAYLVHTNSFIGYTLCAHVSRCCKTYPWLRDSALPQRRRNQM